MSKWNAWVEEITDDGAWMAGDTDEGNRWHGLWPISDVPEDMRKPGSMCRMEGVKIVEWCRETWTDGDLAAAEKEAEDLFVVFGQEVI